MAKLHPVLIIVFSGKRKSGKDYITELLKNRLGCEACSILRLSWPLKDQYSKENNLDLDRLLDASEYKERCRADMIRWGEEKRSSDPGYFIRIIAEGTGSERPIWVISDARRRSDVSYLRKYYNMRIITVRVTANDETRRERGWIFTPGVDDAESECDLDSSQFDVTISNDGDDVMLEHQLTELIADISKKYQSNKSTSL